MNKSFRELDRTVSGSGVIYLTALFLWGLWAVPLVAAPKKPSAEERTIAFYRQMFNEVAHSSSLKNVPPPGRWPKHEQLASYLMLEIFYHPSHNTSIKELERFVRRWPNHPQMHRIQRFLDKRIVRDGSMRKVLSRLDKRRPPNTLGRIRYLKALVSVKRNEEAKRLWTKLYRSGVNLPEDLEQRLSYLLAKASQKDHEARVRALMRGKNPRPFEEALKWLPEKRRIYFRALHAAGGADTLFHPLLPQLSKKDRTTGELWHARIEGLRRNGFYQRAERLLLGAEGRYLSDKDRRRQLYRLGRVFLFIKRDFKRAFRLFEANIKEKGGKLEDSMWMAGWSAHMGGERAQALALFKRLADEGITAERRSQGAWWASRVLAGMSKKKESHAWRLKAAQYPGTFFGLLAREGLEKGIKGIAPLKEPELKCVFPKSKAFQKDIKRLTQLERVGRSYYNGPEIAAIAAKHKLGDSEQLCLARKHGDPNHSIRVSNRLRKGGGPALWSYLFPIAPWRPWTKWHMDRSLIWGMARQESLMLHRVRSRVGARGLLQLMPATARKEASILNMPPATQFRLQVPGYNLSLGQSYMSRMMGQLSGNPILGLIAYNAGPHRAARWRKAWNREQDVLTFMENIPITETRKYVRKVLRGVVMYELQFKKQGSIRQFLKFKPMPLNPISG
ncbi:MAG: lytic transglycosylase domain-containing protein [Magnetococcales bacterium]|nr:lytic transglycosylase domain-containing protein [Magnetococcales bacterium]